MPRYVCFCRCFALSMASALLHSHARTHKAPGRNLIPIATPGWGWAFERLREHHNGWYSVDAPFPMGRPPLETSQHHHSRACLHSLNIFGCHATLVMQSFMFSLPSAHTHMSWHEDASPSFDWRQLRKQQTTHGQKKSNIIFPMPVPHPHLCLSVFMRPGNWYMHTRKLFPSHSAALLPKRVFTRYAIRM